MPDIPFQDQERQLILTFMLERWVALRVDDDPEMAHARQELYDIIRKLEGSDTVLIARKP